MWDTHAKYLITIIGIIHLSGGCSAPRDVSREQNAMATATEIARSVIQESTEKSSSVVEGGDDVERVQGDSAVATNASQSPSGSDTSGQSSGKTADAEATAGSSAVSMVNFTNPGNETAVRENIVLQQPDSTLRETAGLVATGFLLFSILGYVGFVLWRRYLLKKYGNSQLITEDVYDTSDLRHFEI